MASRGDNGLVARSVAAAAITVAVIFAAMLVATFAKPGEHHAPMGAERSGQWPKVRAEYLEKHPACECCGTKKDLEVHHCLPFHEDESLELDEKNLITLCRRCHLLVGHLDSWKSWNEHVRKDAALFSDRIKNRPRRTRNDNSKAGAYEAATVVHRKAMHQLRARARCFF
jgi:hypothetical protein